MAGNFKQPGNVMDYTAVADVISGQAVLVGKRLGVALANIKAGETGSVQVEGVFSVKKKAGDAPGQGDQLYWSAAGSELTTTASGNTLAGYAFAAAAADAATVDIKLNA